MSNDDVTSITIVDNVSVTVPASAQLMTTYILQEQNDWFEDEIKFIRHFVKPGMKIIDIGANYGLYTLSMAKIIGDSGKIWAFEPTRETSACLKKSIAENRFKNIVQIQSGLSDKVGKARLYTSPNSELNSMSKEVVGDGESETISLLTLDHCMHKYGWKHIDFIKLDAEGEESNILKKGKKALSNLSPLIMFELKHGENINLPVINRFKNMGYVCYRLLPGLNTLVPFDSDQPVDGFQLNLFCCKEETANQLETDGVMVRAYKLKSDVDGSLAREHIAKTAYWESLKHHIHPDKHKDSDEYLSILSSYIMSLSESKSSSDRVAYLMNSLQGLRKMIEKEEQSIERLVTFSRIAFDAGERSLGVELLTELVNKYYAGLKIEISELLLPASQRYEDINPDTKINEWLFSSILEKCIEKHAFSSYFTQRASLPLFEKLHALGFISEDMQRRHHLVKTSYPV